MFEIGKIYNRRDDIHAKFGGQWRSGISTPSGHPFVFIFTGDTGAQYGYSDGWDSDGVFFYTGEGQLGPMQFIRGNSAIRDHAANGKDLLLFESLGPSRGYRFLGTFGCADYEFRNAPDVTKTTREVIVFHLVPANEVTDPSANVSTSTASGLSMDELRRRAMAASIPPQANNGKQARRTYYERSKAVRDYVLARAAGVCESCGNPAPFKRSAGSPYLEPHHTRRLSDDGPDHPAWVAAICPNCHREIHHGACGEEKNRILEKHLKTIESAS